MLAEFPLATIVEGLEYGSIEHLAILGLVYLILLGVTALDVLGAILDGYLGFRLGATPV